MIFLKTIHIYISCRAFRYEVGIISSSHTLHKEIAHEEHTYDEAFEMSEVVQSVDVRNKNNPYANVRDIQDLNEDLHRPQSIGFKRDSTRWMKGAAVVSIVNSFVMIAVIIFLGLREGTDQFSLKVDGGWSTWGSWSECSASCGTGMTSRNRSCSNPKPNNGGDRCLGDSTEYRVCNTFACPSTGIGFSVYSPVSGTGVGSSSALRFSHVVKNSTSAFNMATGEFVCRQPGLYFFSTTVLRSSAITQAVYCYFYKNSIQHSYVAGYASDPDTDNPSGTNSILYHLLPGDTVSLRSCSNSDYFSYSSSFTGFLVHADN